MDHEKQTKFLADAQCAVRFDALTKQLYATDASVHQVEPQAVAFPKSREEIASIIAAAVSHGLPITPRGAGTGLTGGALGQGMVIDFSRHNRAISEFDAERRTVRVDPGVVLDQLNAFLNPHGLRFGPDVATSSRATLGGMIANNSSGSHVPLYGTTADHILSLDIALTDGRILTIGKDHDTLPEIHSVVARLVRENESAINEHCPEGLLKRWPGYAFDRWMRHSADLTKIISGSEGTLASIVSAELSLSPLPRRKSLGVLFFASVTEAMQATVELLDLKPAAIEHIDRVLFDQTRDRIPFRKARALLELDEKPCESILLVEFFDDEDNRVEALRDRALGLRHAIFTDPSDQGHVWGLRKAGLSLLTSCKGPAKPTSGVEDAAVLPEQLPDYVAELQKLFARLDLRGSFYGHAASGLLHVRPVLDMHTAEDVAKYRQLADEVSDLVKQFKGSIAAEHGVGIAHTEFIADHLSRELVDALAEVKRAFDPNDLMNPGKIVDTGVYKIDTNLRQGAGHAIELPFEPVLAFATRDESFVGNLEQCNGCGGCRKSVHTMCPTYIATGDELMSTRGRANTIRAALEGRLNNGGEPLYSVALEEALSDCLSCKACETECPSNVNLALLKAELNHARHAQQGLTSRERMISRVDLLGALATVLPRLSNAALRSRFVRGVLDKRFGIASNRAMPPYALQRFDHWFEKRAPQPKRSRGRVLLWDDCFVRYNEPPVGQAAVQVLEAMGFEVELVKNRACCGRPAFSTGRLDLAAEFGKVNLEILRASGDTTPILFLEPSCFSMFAEDYRELKLHGASEIAERTFLFEQFVEQTLQDDPAALRFIPDAPPAAIHAHCHAKAITDTSVAQRLAGRACGEATLLDTGCCGMAGAFGMMNEKQALSIDVAQPLLGQLDALPDGTRLIASGTSCRHQIDDLHTAKPLHMAQYLADVMAIQD